jgi:type IV secretion system protein VirB10
MTTPNSPDSLQLRQKYNVGARLGRRGLAVVIVLLLVAFGLVIYNTESRKAAMAAKPEQEKADAAKALGPAADAAKAFNSDVGDEVIVSKPTPASVPSVASVPTLAPAGAGSAAMSTQVPPIDPQAVALAQQKQADEKAAMNADVGAQGWSDGGNSSGSGSPEASNAQGLNSALAALAKTNEAALQAASGAAGGGQGSQSDPNAQRQKSAFAAPSSDLSTPILGTSVKAAVSPYELNTGTVVNGYTLTEVNSDLPGQLIGVISRTVYDSATGSIALVPMGTKAYGHYNSQVAYGQVRIQVCWDRFIFPNGSTLELGCMNGADAAGQAGLTDQVNNHYLRILGFGVATSLFSAAFQLSQPQQTNTTGQPSSREIAAGSVAQEISQLGIQITQKNLDIQPTITIRPGYSFVIELNKDIVFPGPYAVTP